MANQAPFLWPRGPPTLSLASGVHASFFLSEGSAQLQTERFLLCGRWSPKGWLMGPKSEGPGGGQASGDGGLKTHPRVTVMA